MSINIVCGVYFNAQFFFEKCTKQIFVKFDVLYFLFLILLGKSWGSTTAVWRCEWNHFKIKQCQHVPSLPRWRPTFRGHHISAGCAAALEASAGVKGSGSIESCIKDKSGGGIYLSSSSQTFLTKTGSAGTADVQEQASLLGVWWAEAPGCCWLRSDWLTSSNQFGIMELHQRLNWIWNRTRWRPSVYHRQFKRKWNSQSWHTQTHLETHQWSVKARTDLEQSPISDSLVLIYNWSCFYFCS